MKGAGNLVSGSTVSISNDMVLTSNATAINALNNTFTMTGDISGAFSLITGGGHTGGVPSGTIIFTGNNSYGDTFIDAGTLQIGNGGTSGTLGTGSVNNSSALSINRSDTLIIPGSISGSGSLTQAGTGTSILEGNNSYTGGTTISAGTLQVGNGGATGTITNNILNNAALVFNSSGSFTYSDIISGTGTVTKSGAGGVTLSGANTYSGNTTLTAGTLTIDSDSTGSITNGPLGTGSLIMTGGTLASSGAHSIANPYTINGTVELVGSSGMTLSGNGNLSSGSLDATSGTVILSGDLIGAGGLMKSGTGTLDISGTDNSVFSGDTTLSAGSLRLFSATNGFGSGQLLLNGGTLQVVSNASFANDYTVNGNVILFHSGTGTTTNLGGDGNLNSGSLSFSQNNNETYLDGNLTGSAPIFIGGGRTVTFAGADNSGYSGDITINGQTRASTATNAMGTGDLILQAGLLNGTGGVVLENDYAVAPSATFSFSGLTLNGLGTFGANSLTAITGVELSGNISGAGTLETRNGTLTISGADNSGFSGTVHVGSTSFHVGNVIIGSATNALGTGSLAFYRGTLSSSLAAVLNNDFATAGTGGSITINGSNDLALNGTGNLSSNTVSVVVSNTGTTTLGGNLSGADSLSKTGAGTLVLLGADNSSYSGTVNLTGGILQVGNGGTTGTLGTGTLTNNASLVFDRSSNATITTPLIGTGSVTQQGAGSVITLSGVNTYSGGTFITDGTILANNNSAFGSGSVTVSSGATLQIQNGIDIGNTLSITGVGVSSAGALQAIGSGTGTASGVITLAGNSTFGTGSGSTLETSNTINGTGNGTESLTLGGSGSYILSGAIGNGTSTPLSTLASSRPVTLNAGTVTTAGAQTYTGTVTMGANTTVSNASGNISFGTIVGTAGLIINSAGAATLGSVNTGALTVTAPSGITSSSTSLTTIGDMRFNNTITMPNSASFTTTGGGSMWFNTIAGTGCNSCGSVVMNAGGGPAATITINGAITSTNSSVNITSPSGIILNTPSTLFARTTMTFNGPVNLLQTANLTTRHAPATITFSSTVDGPGGINGNPGFNNGFGTQVIFNGDIGATTPLSFLSMPSNDSGGFIQFKGAINVTGAVTLSNNANFGTGAILFDAPAGTVSNVGTLSATAGGRNIGGEFIAIRMNGNTIISTGNQTYSTSGQGGIVGGGLLQLTGGDVTLTSTGGSIIFPSNGSSPNGSGISSDGTPRSLTINGNASFGTLIGSGTTPAPATTANPLSSLTVNGLATFTGNGDSVTTTGDQNYNGGVSLGVNTSLSSLNGGDISFGTNLVPATINNARSLTINSGVSSPGDVNFWGAVGNTTALTALDVTGDSINIYGGSMRTSGAQTYRNLVTLFSNTILTSTGSSLNLLANITSDTTARDLTLTAASPTVLSGNLGTPNLLNSLTVTNATTLGADILTVGAQTYNGAVTLNGDSTLTTNTGGTITFGNTVDGGFNLVTNPAGGTTTFTGAVGNTTPLASLVSSTQTQIGSALMKTSGTQQYMGLVTTANTANPNNLNFESTSGGNITFNGSLLPSGSPVVNITITGNLEIAAPNGSWSFFPRISSLTVTGSTLMNTIGGIITDQNQTYMGPVILAANGGFGIENGNITFGSTIEGPHDVLVQLAGTSSVTFNGAIGGTGGANPLNTVTITGLGVTPGVVNLNTSEITTIGDQTFTNSAVVLGADTTLTSTIGGDMQFTSTIDGAQALVMNTDGTITFDGAVGGGTRLTSLTANSDLVVNGGGISTTGSQVYTNSVTLGGATVFDVNGAGTHSIAFNGGITGGQDLTLQGTGTGSYNFTLNSFTANDVMVTAGLGSNNNTLNLDTGGMQDFTLTGTDIGDVDSIITANSFNFNNIQNLNGGSGDDSFTFNGGTLSGSINGGAGVNSLTGANTANMWAINANNGGSVTGLGGTFSNIENLTGGTDVDTFDFAEGFSISGMVNGGDLIMNHINFDTFTSVLSLTLALPVTNILDKGIVKYADGSLVTNFNLIQQSTGNDLGTIFTPDKSNITVTFYDDTLLNGEIGDPFYFNGWNVPVPATPPGTGTVATDVAGIVNQPQTNAEDNDNYSPTYGSTSYDPTVLNKTYVDPLLNTTSVQAGAACYQVIN